MRHGMALDATLTVEPSTGAQAPDAEPKAAEPSQPLQLAVHSPGA
jgi:hypothetical protein